MQFVAHLLCIEYLKMTNFVTEAVKLNKKIENHCIYLYLYSVAKDNKYFYFVDFL